MEHWTSLCADTEQETTEVLESPLEGEGSVLVWYQYAPPSGNDEVLDETSESILALSKVRTDGYISCPC
jgi:hypothetical protein